MTSIYALTDETATPAPPLPETNGYFISGYDLNGHLVQEWVPDFNHYTYGGFYEQEWQWLSTGIMPSTSITIRTNADGTVTYIWNITP